MLHTYANVFHLVILILHSVLGALIGVLLVLRIVRECLLEFAIVTRAIVSELRHIWTILRGGKRR
jgi:hypothetical protein